MKFKICVFFLFLMSLCMAGRSQEIRVKLDRCTLDKKTLSHVQDAFIFQLDFYGKIFGGTSVPRLKARIFDNEKEFKKYAAANVDFKRIGKDFIGLYSGRLQEMILHKEVPNLAAVFSHELSHALLHAYCENPRTWLTEGLAELFEDLEFTDSTSKLNFVDHLRSARFYLSTGSSIKDILDDRDFYLHHAGANYTLSWAVVMYLYETNQELLSRLIQTDCALTEDNNALQQAYPGGMDLLESDVKAFFFNQIPILH